MRPYAQLCTRKILDFLPAGELYFIILSNPELISGLSVHLWRCTITISPCYPSLHSLPTVFPASPFAFFSELELLLGVLASRPHVSICEVVTCYPFLQKTHQL